MALQLTITHPSGLQAVNAYHKVTRVNVSASGPKAFLVFTLTTYVSKEAADAEAPPVVEREFRIDDFDTANPSNIATLIYMWIKARVHGFSFAVDV